MKLPGLPFWAAGLLLASAAVLAAERDPTWASLTAAQRQVLAPLQREWVAIDPSQREKWLEVAAKFPKMPADERQRLQNRMSEWVRMSPTERATARQQFQEVKRLPTEERQERWQAYQALTPEERNKLAQQRAKPVTKQPAGAASRSTSEPDPGTGKRNIVRAPAAAPTRVVSPTVVQARPGATTTTMSTRAAPPLHHQAGLPKIAATPGFVDPATLLPQRGPQGAAVRSTEPADRNKKP
ncbi:MAG: DUF3106 domain-containing protein [Rubrivivax sp.]|nr:DUF3106 domain-containing protein [Rubrivivax sp.]